MNLSGQESYGMLYYADIHEFSIKPHSEIEKVYFFVDLPVSWTYPDIQPHLIQKVQKSIV